MLKYTILVLAACVALWPQPGRTAELTSRDLTQDEQAMLAGGLQFLANNLGIGTPRIRWLKLYLSGENPQTTAYCGVVNGVYLFQADITVQDGAIASVGQIRLAVQGDEVQRAEAERRCAAAGYGKELGADFLAPPASTIETQN